MMKPSAVVPGALALFFLLCLILSFAPPPEGVTGSSPERFEGYGRTPGWDTGPPMEMTENPGQPVQAGVAGPFHLTFPHTANGSAAGINCRSSMVLVNNSETNANGTIQLFQQAGTPLVVGTNRGIDDQFDFTLMPGESYRLETDGTGSLKTGWIQVTSDIPLSGSGTFVLADGTGKFLSEVGIGNSATVRNAMIFVDTTSGRDTSLAICNPNASSNATVNLELRKLDGSVLANRSGTPLPPNGQQAKYIRELFPGTIAGVNWASFKGVLVVKSPDTDIGVVTLRTRGTSLTSLPAAPEAVSSLPWSNLTFARIGDGLIGPYRFQTSIVLLNNSTNPVTTTLETLSEAGTPASLNWGSGPVTSVSVSVPAGGAAELNSSGGNNPAVVGWVRTSSTGPIAGSALFTISEQPSGLFVSQTGVPDSPRSSRIGIFGQVSPTVDTGFGITNPYAGELQVNLRLYRTNGPGQFGTFLSQKSLTLPGYGHTARFISEFFSDVPDVKNKVFEGTVIAENPYSWEFNALTLRTRGVYFTSLPVAPLADTTFAPRFTFFASTLLEGTRPYTCFRVVQDYGNNPVKEAVITLDRGQFDLELFKQAGTHGDFLEFILDSILYFGKVFVHEISSDSVGVFSLITGDGVEESSPALFTLKNLASGGVEIRISSSYPAATRLSQASASCLCLEPGAFLLPSGKAQSVSVKQEYESWERTPATGDSLHRSAQSSFSVTTTPATQPRINSVAPHRVKAGDEVVIQGANFSPVAAENTVNFKGKVSYSSPAEVLEASVDRLRVRVPSDAAGSELGLGYRNDIRVVVAGKTSLPYSLDVTFSPSVELGFSNLAAGANSALTLSVKQGSVELGLMETVLKASAGSWIVAGFTPGQVIGTLTSAYRQYSVKVVSSDAAKLVMEATLSGSQDPPAFRLEATAGASGRLKVNLLDLTYTYLIGGNELKVEFSQPVFKMPASAGVGFTLEAVTHSLPERTKVMETAIEMKSELDFSTK